MKIAIVGPGAVGSFLGTLLTHSKLEVGYLGPKGPIENTFSFEVKKKIKSFHFPKRNSAFFKEVELVLFSVKAFQISHALDSHLNRFAPGTCILFLGNGLIHPEVLERAGKNPQFLYRLGVTTFGITKKTGNHYELKSQGGNIWLGPFEPSMSLPSPIEKKLPPTFKWVPHIFPFYKTKWLMNAVVNPLVVYLKVEQNGGLLAHLPTVKALFEEVYSLGEQLFGSWESSKPTLWKQIVNLLKKTKNNRNSLWQDALNGNKTEISYLLGPCEAFPSLTFANKIFSSLKLQLDRKNKRKLKV